LSFTTSLLHKAGAVCSTYTVPSAILELRGYLVASSVSICSSCYVVWPAMSLRLLIVRLVVNT
jgi:hypothetical protein